MCGSVQTFHVGREELSNVFLVSSIRSELCGLPLSAYCGPNLHRLSNSECFLTHFLCFYVGIHLLVNQPGINHRCVNQVTENSKIPFLISISMWKLPMLLLGKSTFPMWLIYVDTSIEYDISTCSFFFLTNCLICEFSSSPTNVEMQATLLLSSNVKSGTLPESTSVEYSCGGRGGGTFFFILFHGKFTV